MTMSLRSIETGVVLQICMETWLQRVDWKIELYKLSAQGERASSFVGKQSDDIEMWHKLLEHINFNRLRFLNLNIPSGLKCKVRMKGKQPR